MPHQDKLGNQGELINDFLLLVTFNSIMLTTGIINEIEKPEAMVQVGWTIMVCCGLIVAFNLFIIIKSVFTVLRRKFKLIRLAR